MIPVRVKKAIRWFVHSVYFHVSLILVAIGIVSKAFLLESKASYLEALGVLGELLIVWVIYVEVGGTRKQHRVETILDLYDRYEKEELAAALRFFRSTEFTSYDGYESLFGADGKRRQEADGHRRRIKRFLARMGKLLQEGLAAEDEVFMMVLPDRLWKEKLSPVEEGLRKKVGTETAYKAGADSCRYADYCIERYRLFIGRNGDIKGG